MRVRLILIQCISLYRAITIFYFILFNQVTSIFINNFLFISSIISDYLDGYLAKKFKLETEGGELLDLFSDKYLNIISIIFLITENYPIFPLLIILTKEIFVLSFRSIKINNNFILKTNRLIGGFMSLFLYIIVLLNLNNIFLYSIYFLIYALGILNFIYLIYKIYSNLNYLKIIFKLKK